MGCSHYYPWVCGMCNRNTNFRDSTARLILKAKLGILPIYHPGAILVSNVNFKSGIIHADRTENYQWLRFFRRRSVLHRHF
jgi:hypothetical protein